MKVFFHRPSAEKLLILSVAAEKNQVEITGQVDTQVKKF